MFCPTEAIFKILTGYMSDVKQGRKQQKSADASAGLEKSAFSSPRKSTNYDLEDYLQERQWQHFL